MSGYVGRVHRVEDSLNEWVRWEGSPCTAVPLLTDMYLNCVLNFCDRCLYSITLVYHIIYSVQI